MFQYTSKAFKNIPRMLSELGFVRQQDSGAAISFVTHYTFPLAYNYTIAVEIFPGNEADYVRVIDISNRITERTIYQNTPECKYAVIDFLSTARKCGSPAQVPEIRRAVEHLNTKRLQKEIDRQQRGLLGALNAVVQAGTQPDGTPLILDLSYSADDARAPEACLTWGHLQAALTGLPGVTITTYQNRDNDPVTLRIKIDITRAAAWFLSAGDDVAAALRDMLREYLHAELHAATVDLERVKRACELLNINNEGVSQK